MLRVVSSGHGERGPAGYLSEAELAQSIVISDPGRSGNPIVYVSDEFEAQTGYAPDEALGRNCRFLQGQDTSPAAIEEIRQALREERPITIDLVNYKKDGTPFWNRLRIRPLHDPQGRLVYFAGAQNPIAPEDVRPYAVTGVID